MGKLKRAHHKACMGTGCALCPSYSATSYLIFVPDSICKINSVQSDLCRFFCAMNSELEPGDEDLRFQFLFYQDRCRNEVAWKVIYGSLAKQGCHKSSCWCLNTKNQRLALPMGALPSNEVSTER